MASDRWYAVPLGVLAVLGAGFAFHVARVWRWVDCSNEAWSECSTPGLVQEVIAGLGIVPALVMLVLAISGRGHPWRWFVATAVVYMLWGGYVASLFG